MPKDAHFRVSADEIYVFFCSFVLYTANIGVHVKAKSSLAKSKKIEFTRTARQLGSTEGKPQSPFHTSTRITSSAIFAGDWFDLWD